MEKLGKYKTKQKEIILEYLKANMERHITADEIVEYVNKNDKKVGQTTVYRFLDFLLKNGIVRKYFIDENIASCYQYINNNEICSEHFHLKCEKCSKLMHIENNLLQKIEKDLQAHYQFKLNNNKTVLYGICKDCREKAK